MLVGLIEGHEVRDLRVPVVHAVNVHASGKQIRSASKPERGEVAAIATAPEPDAAGVHVRPGAKIDACALDIIELAGAHRPVIESFAKIEAVANSAAIVYGEHDVAAAREVLIQRVSIAVVEHVVPAEEHLAARTTVEEHNGGMAGRFARIRREEELAVNLHAVSGGENHLLRSDQSAGRKIRGSSFGGEVTEFTFAGEERRTHGRLGVGMEHEDSAIVACYHGRGFYAAAGGHCCQT